jgi:ferredoxin
MIITEQKPIDEIIKYLKKGEKLFIIGCGECSTTCKTGGEKEVKEMIERLKEREFEITGFVIPKAPCIASQIKIELAKHKKEIQNSDSILIFACGLGAQSVKENQRIDKPIHVGCNTLFTGVVDPTGLKFLEYCSACGDCILELTGGICPVTRCSKGLLNGPCGGMDDGKCEVDKNRDCAWVLIYKELEKQGKLDLMKEIKPAKDYSKKSHPHVLELKKN